MNFESNVQNNSEQVSYFYIDETFIEIEGKKHIIVCAISPNSPSESSLKIVEVKKQLGFKSLDEVKINTKGLTQSLKVKLTDGILDVIGDCTAFISIIKGENKQESGEMIAYQLFDYCNQNSVKGFFLYFDKDLVPNPREFEQFVRNNLLNGAECFGIQHFNSTSEQLIQCSDVFLGLFRLSMEIAFGKRAITRKVYIPSIDDEDDFSLEDYVILSSRGQIWGKVETRKSSFGDDIYGNEYLMPFHCSFDLGIRIKSSISDNAKKIIEEKLATVYLGCLS